MVELLGCHGLKTKEQNLARWRHCDIDKADSMRENTENITIQAVMK